MPSATRDAFTLPPVLFRVHRVLRMLIWVHAARRPRTTTARPCAGTHTDGPSDDRRTGRRGGRVVGEDHHGVSALGAGRHCERDEGFCWHGGGWERREGGEREGRVGGVWEWVDVRCGWRRRARRWVLLCLQRQGGGTCLRFRSAGGVRRRCCRGGWNGWR